MCQWVSSNGQCPVKTELEEILERRGVHVHLSHWKAKDILKSRVSCAGTQSSSCEIIVAMKLCIPSAVWNRTHCYTSKHWTKTVFIVSVMATVKWSEPVLSKPHFRFEGCSGAAGHKYFVLDSRITLSFIRPLFANTLWSQTSTLSSFH